MLAEFRATFEFSCIDVPVRAVSRMTSPLDSSPTSWTQFANELRSSIDPQLFEPSFCTDTQVRCAVLHFNSSKFILRDVHADWRFREGRAAANGQVSAAHRALMLSSAGAHATIRRCVQVSSLASEVNILGRLLHRSINQHRSSKHLARIRQLRRLVKQTIALGMDKLLARTSLICVSMMFRFYTCGIISASSTSFAEK